MAKTNKEQIIKLCNQINKKDGEGDSNVERSTDSSDNGHWL